MKNIFRSKTFLIFLLLVATAMMVSADVKLVKRTPLTIKLKVTAEITAFVKHYRGVCPAEVKMTGKIKAPKAMMVSYYFKKNDNSRIQWKQLTFPGAGSKEVPFLWKINKNFVGEVQLIVKTSEYKVKSNIVRFDVECEGMQVQAKPLLKIDWSKFKKPELKSENEFKMEKETLGNLINFIDLRIVKFFMYPPTAKIINYNQVLRIVSRFGNQSVQKTPPCKLTLTLVAEYPHPVHGKVMVRTYAIPSIKPGQLLMGAWQFHHFWPGEWRVIIKIDSDNIITESNENNNWDAKIFNVIY